MISIAVQQNIAFWSQRQTFDGVDYQLDFNWNGRDGAWYVNLFTIDGEPLVFSIKLVTNRPLFQRFHHIEGMPAGEMVAFDGSKTIDRAGYTDLNNGVELLYLTAEEYSDVVAARGVT